MTPLRTSAEIRAEIEANDAAAVATKAEIARVQALLSPLHDQQRVQATKGSRLAGDLRGAKWRESIGDRPAVIVVDYTGCHVGGNPWLVDNVTPQQIHLSQITDNGHDVKMVCGRDGKERGQFRRDRILDLAPVEAFIATQKAEKKGRK